MQHIEVITTGGTSDQTTLVPAAFHSDTVTSMGAVSAKFPQATLMVTCLMSFLG